MPRKRRTGKTRYPINFEAISAGERVRWGLGSPLIEGEFTPVHGTEGMLGTVWPSWQAWAETYALCRLAYLTWFAERHPGREPGSELLFEAYLAGEDPGAVVIPTGPDPRRFLAVP